MALYYLSDHARQNAKQRGISLDDIDQLIRFPHQIVEAEGLRRVYQSLFTINTKTYLLRAIVEESKPKIVVTVYRTTQINKYWRKQ